MNFISLAPVHLARARSSSSLTLGEAAAFAFVLMVGFLLYAAYLNTRPPSVVGDRPRKALYTAAVLGAIGAAGAAIVLFES